jgi:hypothetical protein
MRTSMGLETTEPFFYPRLPPPVVEDPWAWYHNTERNGDNNDEIKEESE